MNKMKDINVKKRNCSDLNKKIQIIKMLYKGVSIRETALKLNVTKGVVQNAKNRRDVILIEAESGRSLKKTRIVKQSDINTILWRWFKTARGRGYPISGPILQEMAKKIANELGSNTQNFVASEGWLQKWKNRNNVKTYAVCGESGTNNLIMVNEWKITLGSLIGDIKLENVFNMDETGYFFRALPDSTLSHIGDKCIGGRNAKDRLTVVLTCSAAGEKLPPMLIGKSKKPRCFTGVDLKKYNIEYNSSPKAWMTNNIFNIYLENLDKYFIKQKRKILLFLDNAPVHILNSDVQLKNIKLQFLPPNLTSALQPLDAGIIQNMKILARKFQVLSLIQSMNTGKHVSELSKELTLLDAIKFITKSWQMVTKDTIIKCFKKCGFYNEDFCMETLEENEEAFNDLINISRKIGLTSKLFVEENLQEFESSTEEELINNLINEYYDNGIDDDNDDEISEEMEHKNDDDDDKYKMITNNEAKEHLRNLILYTKSKGFIKEEMDLLAFYERIEIHQSINTKQSYIETFFKKS